MTGGFGLNVTNQMAAQFYADHGLNSVLILPEVKDSDISTIAPTRNGKPVPTGVLVYGHMPLMVTRACPLQNIHDCAHCNKAGELTDRKAKKFPVRCGMGVRTIYNPVPIYMGDKPGALTVDYGVATSHWNPGKKLPPFWTASVSTHPLRESLQEDFISREPTKDAVSPGGSESFSEDRPLGWDLLPQAVGRAMEWPVSCPRRKLPEHARI